MQCDISGSDATLRSVRMCRSIFEVATISCNRIKACQDFERLPRCSGLKTVQAAMALIAVPLVWVLRSEKGFNSTS